MNKKMTSQEIRVAIDEMRVKRQQEIEEILLKAEIEVLAISEKYDAILQLLIAQMDQAE